MTQKEKVLVEIHKRNRMTFYVSDEEYLIDIKTNHKKWFEVWDAALDWAAENATIMIVQSQENKPDEIIVYKQSILKGKE